MSLASTHQCMPPSATNLTAHTPHSKQISWNCVVIEVSLHHAIQPFVHNGDGLVPSSHQFCPDFCKSRSHSLLERQATDLETALPVETAAVRKSKEVKRFRLALFPAFTIGCCEPTKLDQPRLRRIQGPNFASRSVIALRNPLAVSSLLNPNTLSSA
jgi:hypothetical protein